jgi:superfamily II DNA helicase RecQ
VLWLRLSRQFIQKGLIYQDTNSYNVLKITEKGYRVMKGNETVKGTLSLPAVQREGGDPDSTPDSELFALLRQKRKDLAGEEGCLPMLFFLTRHSFR